MRICIGTLIKDEQEYLEDWIKYNIELGFDKIFITEDITSTSHKQIFDRYPDKVEKFEIVDENIDFTGAKTYGQPYSFKKMLEHAKSLGYDWCFLIDIDEYITITENLTLKELLNEYSEFSELMLYWKNFGANGHVDKPDYSAVDSYREYYTSECDYTDLDRKYTHIMKKAINLRKISDKYKVSIHYHSTGGYIKTNFKKGIYDPCFDRIYLSHYITKSFEEYKWKLLTRGLFSVGYRFVDDFFEMNKDMLPLKEKLLNA